MPIIRCFGRGFRVPDLDQLFCYETVKLVNVLDWIPGVIYRAGIIFACLYCLGFALIINQMYLRHTQATGSVMITATGDAWSQPSLSTDSGDVNTGGATRRLLAAAPTPAPFVLGGENPGGRQLLATKAPTSEPTAANTAPNLPEYRYWDVHDTVNPDSESGGIVLATRVLSTKEQIMAPCPNKETACPDDCKTDLPIYPGLCYPQTDFCMEFNWCPLFGQGGEKSTEDLIEGVDDFELDFMATMAFDQSDLKKVVVQHVKMKVSELLKKVGVSYASIQSTGITLYTRLQWGTAESPCDSDAGCEIDMQVVRMDENPKGFYFRQSTYYRGNGTLPKEYRDVSRTYGIRVVASSNGYAVSFSMTNAMLQVACAFSMFALAYVVADIFVVFLNTRASKYTELKVEETPDISDLKEKQEAAKIDQATNKKSRRPRINRARQKKPETESDEDD
eukprot:TRINITY_DN1367_c0_g1_i1.p1 TRINITY_DN1367_c0_g1~~TRINITY_DN1367_c0_g1_i1.p1  ORF type:complete len:449 (+),score=99.87 TRINITY_DN1367_c0_g1_i1:71-1417(+)